MCVCVCVCVCRLYLLEWQDVGITGTSQTIKCCNSVIQRLDTVHNETIKFTDRIKTNDLNSHPRRLRSQWCIRSRLYRRFHHFRKGSYHMDPNVRLFVYHKNHFHIKTLIVVKLVDENGCYHDKVTKFKPLRRTIHACTCYSASIDLLGPYLLYLFVCRWYTLTDSFGRNTGI